MVAVPIDGLPYVTVAGFKVSDETFGVGVVGDGARVSVWGQRGRAAPECSRVVSHRTRPRTMARRLAESNGFSMRIFGTVSRNLLALSVKAPPCEQDHALRLVRRERHELGV